MYPQAYTPGNGDQLKRMFFNKLRQSYVKDDGSGLSADDIRPHQLQVVSKFDNAKPGVSFQITQPSSRHVLDVSLSDADAFLITGIGLAILKVNKVAGVEQPGTFDAIHYPDVARFATAGEAPALENLYNALMELKIDNGSVLSDLHTSIFRVAPDRQEASGFIPQSVNGIVSLPGAIEISGKTNVKASVNFQGQHYTGVAGPAGDDTYAIYAKLILDGFLISRGAASVSAKKMHQLLMP